MFNRGKDDIAQCAVAGLRIVSESAMQGFGDVFDLYVCHKRDYSMQREVFGEGFLKQKGRANWP
jgi:hypothetical protein